MGPPAVGAGLLVHKSRDPVAHVLVIQENKGILSERACALSEVAESSSLAGRRPSLTRYRM
jgi:hypothetical protein